MDIPKYNRVYTTRLEDSVEISPEYIYMTIPSKYLCTYMRLLTMVADLGKEMLMDCTASCKGSGKNITNCWNLFQSALACYALGREDEATFMMTYIDKQIAHLYTVHGADYKDIGVFPISEDGTIKAICTCGEEIKIMVDEETAAAYEAYASTVDDGKVYVETND